MVSLSYQSLQAVLVDAALPVVPMSALVASVAVQTVVALVVAAEARIVAVLPVVVALAGSSAVVLARPVVALDHPLPRTLYHCPEYYL